MPLFGRTLELSADFLNVGQPTDAVLGANGNLYALQRTGNSTLGLFEVENARGEAEFLATFAIPGDTATILSLDEEIGAVYRNPGRDAFAESTIYLESLDPDDAPFTDRVVLASGRLTDPEAAPTDRGFAVTYENSAIGRGEEVIQFHDAEGALTETVAIGP